MRVIKVREIKPPHKIIHEIDVTGKSEHSISRIVDGMEINLNHEQYYVDDTCHEEKQRELVK